MLVSDRAYLIRIFQKMSDEYCWCMDPCVDLMIVVDDNILMKLDYGN